MTHHATTRRASWLLFALSLLWTLALHEHNLASIRGAVAQHLLPEEAALRYGRTVFSIDDNYYISQAQNYRAGLGWKVSVQNAGFTPSPVGDGAYVRRTPVYGLWYYAWTALGDEAGHWALSLAQALLAACASVLFWWILRDLVAPGDPRRARLAWWISLGCTLLPVWNSYAYFTLTEAITPFFTLLLVWICQRAYRLQRPAGYAWAALVLGLSLLTRPNNALLGMIPAGYLFLDLFWNPRRHGERAPLGRALLHAFVLFLPCTAMIGLWTARNYLRTGAIIPLELAYHPETLDRMKPEFRGFWSLTTAWGEDGGEMNLYQYPFWSAAAHGAPDDTLRQRILEAWPEALYAAVGRARVEAVLTRYQAEAARQAVYFRELRPMPAQYSPEQLAIEDEFLALRASFAQAEFFTYWVRAPLRYLRRMVLHSNTSNLHFASQADAPLYVKAWKGASLAVHALSYAGLLLGAWVWRRRREWIPLVLVPGVAGFFFCVLFRVVEQRYMLPFLPLLLLSLSGMGLLAWGRRQAQRGRPSSPAGDA